MPEVGVMFWKKKNFTHTCKFPGALELYRRLWHAHTPGNSQVTWKFTGPEKIQGTWNFSGPLDYFRSPGNFQGAPNFTLDEQCHVNSTFLILSSTNYNLHMCEGYICRGLQNKLWISKENVTSRPSVTIAFNA